MAAMVSTTTPVEGTRSQLSLTAVSHNEAKD